MENFKTEIVIMLIMSALQTTVFLALSFVLIVKIRGEKKKNMTSKKPPLQNKVVSRGNLSYRLGEENGKIDESLFIDCADERLAIRVSRNGLDQFIISTSWPHYFDQKDLYKLQDGGLEIMDVSTINKHVFRLDKSPAAKAETIKDDVIFFILKQLHDIYLWKEEKRKISIKFNLENMTFSVCLDLNKERHADLYSNLISLTDGKDKNHVFNIRSSADVAKHTDKNTMMFFLGNDQGISSAKKLIEETLNSYFPAGIELEYTGDECKDLFHLGPNL